MKEVIILKVFSERSTFEVVRSAVVDHGISEFQWRRPNVPPSLSDRAYHHLDMFRH